VVGRAAMDPRIDVHARLRLNIRIKRTAGIDVLSAVLFAAYPFWVWFGMTAGRRIRSRHPVEVLAR